MKANGFLPENGAIFGDTPEESQIAHKLGLYSIALCGGASTRAQLHAARPHALVSSFAEMRPLLRERGFLQ